VTQPTLDEFLVLTLRSATLLFNDRHRCANDPFVPFIKNDEDVGFVFEVPL
jgi:hypothetical protein